MSGPQNLWADTQTPISGCQIPPTGPNMLQVAFRLLLLTHTLISSHLTPVISCLFFKVGPQSLLAGPVTPRPRRHMPLADLESSWAGSQTLD